MSCCVGFGCCERHWCCHSALLLLLVLLPSVARVLLLHPIRATPTTLALVHALPRLPSVAIAVDIIIIIIIIIIPTHVELQTQSLRMAVE